MQYKSIYHSNIGNIILLSDEIGLVGLFFEQQKCNLHSPYKEKETKVIKLAKKWLDSYFKGEIPNITVPLHFIGTDFQKKVWNLLCDISYGSTCSYKKIASILETKGYQAVGNAIHSNPISIMIPCHRVIGSDGNLTGYAAGIDTKIKLLKIEGIDISKLKMPKEKKRCKWCNLNNSLYVKYHDEEWGRIPKNESYFIEMFFLEMFQAGLSFECVLNKRCALNEAFDYFDIDKICNYDENKKQELLQNKKIIRNRFKINAVIENAKIIKEIQKEFSSFFHYFYTFTKNKIIYENDKTTSILSDTISKDLKRRGMKFVGSIMIYSYLQAIGVINSHEKGCFLYKKH